MKTTGMINLANRRHKNVLLVVIFGSFVCSSFSQSGINPENNDSLKKLIFEVPEMKCINVYQSISAAAFQKIMDKSYTSIATGKGEVSLANYGALDPVAGTFSVNYFTPFKNPFGSKADSAVRSGIANGCPVNPKRNAPASSWYLTLSAGGSLIGNNIGVLFNNSKFNSGTTVSGRLTIPLPHDKIEIIGAEAQKIYLQKRNLEYQRWMEKEQVWRNLDSSRLADQVLYLKMKIKKLELDQNLAESESSVIQSNLNAFHDSLKKALLNPVNNSLITRYSTATERLNILSGQITTVLKTKDSLWYLLDSVSVILQVIQHDHTLMGMAPYPDMANYGRRMYRDIDSRYDHLIDSLEENIPFNPTVFHWIALVGSYNRTDYYTYYDSLPFPKQLTKNTYTTFNYGVEFNLLKTNDQAHWYWNLGALRVRSNNIGDLTTSSLNRQIKASENDSTYTISKTFSAYTDSITQYEAWKFYSNFYLFLKHSTKHAIHFSADVEFRNNRQNPINASVGYIFSVKNSKDNSVLNVEAFFKLIDITRALPEDESHFFNRNMLGLSLGIPLNLPPIK